MQRLSQGHAILLTGIGLSPLRSGLDLRPVHIGFMVDRVALG